MSTRKICPTCQTNTVTSRNWAWQIPGTDGLKLTRRILGNAADYLADDGALICEVGNSMVHLMEQYPDVPFTWLEFDNGGDGVFMLTKKQLLAAREYFAIYKD